MIGVPEMSTGDILLMWLDQQFKRDKYYLCREKKLEVLFYGIFNDN